MKKFFKILISDNNDINEKVFIGFLSFMCLLVILIIDIVSGYLNLKLNLKEYIFDGFLVITLGALINGSVDKWIHKKNNNNFNQNNFNQSSFNQESFNENTLNNEEEPLNEG